MIKDRKVRVCIIGAGNMANNVHYPSLTSFDDVEVVGVIESRARSAQANLRQVRQSPETARFKTRLDSDYRDILTRLKPDGVYVIGQPEIMYPIWNWCLTNGFNLYIEKPMGLTTHQAEALAHLAETEGSGDAGQPSTAQFADPAAGQGSPSLERGNIIHGVVEFFKCDIAP